MSNDEFRASQAERRAAGLKARHETREARAIRRQVAEEIARAIEDARKDYPAYAWNSPEFWQAMDRCVAIAREIGTSEASA